ncbi:MAG: deoxyribodipyrimidine photo-lyase/cryptochrome family protein [Granulosicoccus sp.]
MSKRFQRGLWWVKRDFRLDDNDALRAAIDQCEYVNALFIVEPSLCKAQETSLFHYRAWQQAAEHLGSRLQKAGGVLHVICGEAVDVLDTLKRTTGFDALFSHEETGSNVTFTRDLAVKRWAARNRIHWQQEHQNGVIRGLTDRDKRQPVIRERLMGTPPSAAPVSINGWPLDTAAGEPANTDSKQWPAFETLSGRASDPRIRLTDTQTITEEHASDVLHDFLNYRGIAYSGGISSPNTAFDAGSRLSAHLAWGTISLRRVFHATRERERELAKSSAPDVWQWRKSLKAFQSRLHWHDHFIQRLESAPSMEFEALNPAYKDLGYGDNQQLLDAWQNGQTGLPLIDASMRCLAATGFLNFRMRAMVVSTGCFGMAQSWKSLYYPLARLFLDYEPGIHFSQIQMQAGIVGINTLRVYSPLKQLLDQDPQAIFVKRWIPELREFDATEIAQYNQRILGDYPEPATDFDANTRIIRDQVYTIRKSPEGIEASAVVLEKHGSRLPGNDRNGRRRSTAGRSQKKATTKPLNDSQMRLDFDD